MSSAPILDYLLDKNTGFSRDDFKSLYERPYSCLVIFRWVLHWTVSSGIIQSGETVWRSFLLLPHLFSPSMTRSLKPLSKQIIMRMLLTDGVAPAKTLNSWFSNQKALSQALHEMKDFRIMFVFQRPPLLGPLFVTQTITQIFFVLT